MIPIFAVLSIAILVWIIQRYVASFPPKGTRELPGPKGYPIVGNFFAFPESHPWLKFKEWADIYGPIYKIKTFGVTSIIISDPKIADELLSTRGAIYSDRPQPHMVGLITGGGDLVVSSFNDYWRRGRKFATAMTNATISTEWEPLQAREARRMVVDMARDSSKYQLWLERVATTVSVRQGFGKDLVNADDAEYHTNKIISRMHELEKAGVPGAYLVHTIPALMLLPDWLAPFKRTAKRLYENESSYFYGLFQEATGRFKNGHPESPPSFARRWLEKEDRYDLTWKEAGYVIATLYGGGSGTSSFTMQNYCLAMCHYPEWQEKLHNEIEKVVGPDRVPGFEDWAALPIVRAVSKELLRWRPVVPANVAHRVTKDDVYNGYHIPEGSLVYGNQWSIHRNELMYPDGENFRPDRWLDPMFSTTYQNASEQQPNIRRYSAFGFGRRICPGYEIAERALFIQISSLAWAVRISKKIINGKEVPVPWYDYTNGSNSCPLPFEFDAKPHDERRVQTMRQAIESYEYSSEKS